MCVHLYDSNKTERNIQITTIRNMSGICVSSERLPAYFEESTKESMLSLKLSYNNRDANKSGDERMLKT